MNSALYIGATGMKGLSQGMQVTTNNLANVSTIGYKQQNTLFSDMLSTSQGGTGDWWNAQENSRVALGQTGKGVQVDAVRTIFQQGALESTNTVTDMAINGKGFFQVSDGANLYYTRAGDFRPDTCPQLPRRFQSSRRLPQPPAVPRQNLCILSSFYLLLFHEYTINCHIVISFFCKSL